MNIKEVTSRVFAVIGGALQRRHERRVREARALVTVDAIRCALELPWHAPESDIEIAAIHLAHIAATRESARASMELHKTKADMAARRMEIYPHAN